jgi:hypothetical protein
VSGQAAVNNSGASDAETNLAHLRACIDCPIPGGEPNQDGPSSGLQSQKISRSTAICLNPSEPICDYQFRCAKKSRAHA